MEPENAPGRRVQLSKEEIRSLAMEWISAGLDEKEIARRRSELADLNGVDRRTLGSVSAYVRYPATRAITQSGLKGQMDRDQLIFAAGYLDLASSPDEYTQALAELAETYRVSAASLDDAVRRFRADMERKPVGTLGTATNCEGVAEVVPVNDQPPAGPEIDDPLGGLELPPAGRIESLEEPDAVEDDDIDSGKRGDEADYDFPAKVAWRRALEDYLRDHLSPAAFRDAKVICLPGRLVEPEVSMYLRLGVKRENILAVEGGRRHVRAEFVENASRLGIRHLEGRLEKLLPTLDDRFDIVSYDFHGQRCSAHTRILMDTPVSDRAVLLYNSMAKRESRETQELILADLAHKAAQVQVDFEKGSVRSVWTVHGKSFGSREEAESYYKQHTDLRQARDNDAITDTGILGVGRTPLPTEIIQRFADLPMNRDLFENLSMNLAAFRIRVVVSVAAMKSLYALLLAMESKYDVGVLADVLPKAGRFIRDLGLDSRLCGSLKLLGYRSETNDARSHSPYHTTMGISHHTEPVRERCRQSLDLLTTLALAQLKAFDENGIRYWVDGPEKRRWPESRRLMATDSLRIAVGGWQHSIMVGTLLAEFSAFETFVSRHKINDSIEAPKRTWIR